MTPFWGGFFVPSVLSLSLTRARVCFILRSPFRPFSRRPNESTFGGGHTHTEPPHTQRRVVETKRRALHFVAETHTHTYLSLCALVVVVVVVVLWCEGSECDDGLSHTTAVGAEEA